MMERALRASSKTPKELAQIEHRRAWDRDRKRRKNSTVELGGNESVSALSSSLEVNKERKRLSERGVATQKTEPREAKPEKPPAPKTPPAAKPKRDTGTKLPTDWRPKNHHLERAKALGKSRNWLLAEAEEMRNWALANANRSVARKADWDLTFTTWITRAAGRPAPRNNGPARDTGGLPPPGRKLDTSVFDPRQLTLDEWRFRLKIAHYVPGSTAVHNWNADYGPEPGQPGCLVPRELLDPGSG